MRRFVLLCTAIPFAAACSADSSPDPVRRCIQLPRHVGESITLCSSTAC